METIKNRYMGPRQPLEEILQMSDTPTSDHHDKRGEMFITDKVNINDIGRINVQP